MPAPLEVNPELTTATTAQALSSADIRLGDNPSSENLHPHTLKTSVDIRTNDINGLKNKTEKILLFPLFIIFLKIKHIDKPIFIFYYYFVSLYIKKYYSFTSGK